MEKCICEKLRGNPQKQEELGYHCYTTLYLLEGELCAEGEGTVIVPINYCPFCGKKFK